MSTFITSLILILIGIAMFYPFFFLTIDRSSQNVKETRRFLQLNYLLHILAGGISVVLFWIYSVNYPLQLSGLIYLIVIIVIVLYYWKSPIPQWNLFSASIVFGFIVYIRTVREIVQITPIWPGVLVGLLSTGIITYAVFLFVSTLRWQIKGNIKFSNASSFLNILISLIGIRIAWDLIVLFSIRVGDQNGVIMSGYQFFMQNEFFYFSLAILSGLMIPLILVLVWRQQAKTFDNKKIILLSFGLITFIWIGEFIYKHFLLQYGIVL